MGVQKNENRVFTRKFEQIGAYFMRYVSAYIAIYISWTRV